MTEEGTKEATGAKAKSAAVEAVDVESAPTIDVRTCAVCGRSTALDACAHCGHDPKHDAERAKARLATA